MKKCVACRSQIDRKTSLFVSTCEKNHLKKSANLLNVQPQPSSSNHASSNNNNHNNNHASGSLVGVGSGSTALGPGANVISNNTSSCNNSNVTGAAAAAAASSSAVAAPSNLCPNMDANLYSPHIGNAAEGGMTGDNINHANNTGLSAAYDHADGQLLNNGTKDYTVKKLEQQLQDIKEQVNH
jgi:hypothetical protein